MKIFGNSYFIPKLMVFLLFLTGTVWIELDRSLIVNLPEIAFGNIKLRYYDPLILIIILTIFLKIIKKHKYTLQIFSYYKLWTVLFCWILLQTFLSIGEFGIVNSLGEFRTYYHYLLIIPFIAIYFRLKEDQWSLFILLIIYFSVLLLGLTIFRAYFEYNFRVDSLTAADRWLRSSANLAIIYGLLGIFLAHKYNVLKINIIWLLVFGLVVFLVTVINSHRTVWLVVITSFICLVLLREINIKHIFYISIIITIGVVLSIFVFSSAGIDLITFIQDRGKAFTSFEDDGTSRWRYLLWLQAVDGIINNPFTGTGMGRHFQMIDSQGNLITTAVHNYYLTIGYHTGFIGISLYLMFIAQLFIRFKRGLLKFKTVPKKYVMIATSFIVLISSHIYYLSWEHDIYSWIIISLGASVLISHELKQKIKLRKRV